MTSFKETSRAKARLRWSAAIPEPGLEVFLTSMWRFFISVPSVMLVNFLVFLLSIWLTESLGMPYEVVVGLSIVLIVVATSSWFVLYGRVRQAAGRALGLSARDSRRLEVFGPEALNASVTRIRGEQS